MFRRPQKEVGPHPSQGVWLPNGRWERWAPRDPSVDIQLLKLEAPRIYGHEVDRLCISSSKNFVGALYYALHQATFLNRLKERIVVSEHNFALPNDMAIPFRILSDVPLYVFEKPTHKHRALQKFAPLVLLKQASGPYSGVILQGPYTGVILDTHDDLADPSRGMTINRVWNDELIHEHNIPSPLLYRSRKPSGRQHHG